MLLHVCVVTRVCMQALIWDLQALPRAVEDPILAYKAPGPVNQLQVRGAARQHVCRKALAVAAAAAAAAAAVVVVVVVVVDSS